jgi:hypothetical protein
MRYVHPAAEQKRIAMKKFEKFRAEGVFSAAAARQSHGVPTDRLRSFPWSFVFAREPKEGWWT